jgi:hypothetical protein
MRVWITSICISMYRNIPLESMLPAQAWWLTDRQILLKPYPALSSSRQGMPYISLCCIVLVHATLVRVCYVLSMVDIYLSWKLVTPTTLRFSLAPFPDVVFSSILITFRSILIAFGPILITFWLISITFWPSCVRYDHGIFIHILYVSHV